MRRERDVFELTWIAARKQYLENLAEKFNRKGEKRAAKHADESEAE